MSSILSGPRGLTPSDEQAAIVEAGQSRASFKILAFAGTGKTTTFEFIAQALPNVPIAYLVFNRSAATAAKARFRHAPWVRPTTANGLAWGAMRERYDGRLQGNNAIAERTWLTFMLERGALDDFDASQRARAGRAVITSLTRFLYSGDRAVSVDHVPRLADFDAELLARLGRRLWASIESVDALPVTHDYYFKRYQLSRPTIRARVLLIDESQDVNGVTSALIASQEQSQRIYAGDVHQQLYAFRGAVATLSSLALPAFPLTETRRFGHEIANAANAILEAKGSNGASAASAQPPAMFGQATRNDLTSFCRDRTPDSSNAP